MKFPFRMLLFSSLCLDFFLTQNKETALLQACYKGHLEIVKLLVENDADLNMQEKVILIWFVNFSVWIWVPIVQ